MGASNTRPATLPRVSDTPVRPRARRWERIRGLAAALVLLAVVGGIPCLLVIGVGRPIRHLPSKEWLTQPLDTNAIIAVLAIVGWIAWAHFTVCVVAEWRAELRGAPTTPRIPFGGVMQFSARKLVAAVLLLAGVATIAAGHTAPSPIAHRPATVASSTIASPSASSTSEQAPAGLPVQRNAADPTPASPSPTTASTSPPTQVYEVHAPVGRNYDTLWGISERYLGDGRRYKEIFAANQGRVQPDGAALTKPDLIRPGWILVMPADAKGPGLRAIDPLPVQTAAPAAVATTRGGAAAPSTVRVTGNVPESNRHAGSVGTQQPNLPTLPNLLTLQESQRTQSTLDTLAGSALIAAALLVALRRRRGAFAATPVDDDVATEAKLRLAADVPTAEFVDDALRSLSATLGQAERGLPDVYAAVVDDESLVLRCTTPQTAPPHPWRADDSRTWRLLRADSDQLGEARAELAPYPALATLGTIGSSHVLLDVEAAGGIIAIGGDLAIARDVAAHLAVELATNLWSDDVAVTMVGFGDELSALAPGRLNHEATLEPTLAAAEKRLENARSSLDGIESVFHGRQVRSDRGGLRPHVLVLSGPPSAENAARLAVLASDSRLPLGVIVVGDLRDARWRFIATPPRALDLPLLGLSVSASTLPTAEYRPVIEMFGRAVDPGVPSVVSCRSIGEETFGSVDETPAAFRRDELLVAGREWAVEIGVLGPVSVIAPGGLEESRRNLAAEIAVFLALRENGAHPNVLQAAIWPRGVDPAVMAAALAHVQGWLGNAADGLPRLRQDAHGFWRLIDGVRLDWDVLRTHVAYADEVENGTADVAEAHLAAGLGLIRGPAFAALPAGAYSWLANEAAQREIPAFVVDVAHRAAALAFDRGDPATASRHAKGGLLMCGGSELLWRDVLQAAAKLGHADLERAANAWWEAVTKLRTRDATAAQTDALVAEILPGFKPAA